MRVSELIIEGRNHPVIVVDVQPAYEANNTIDTFLEIIDFVNNQRGPVLMFVNAERDGLTDDTVNDVMIYWEENGFNPDGWNRVTIADKGYGYFRSWMDRGTSPNVIIKVIREMYRQKVSDSRDLFGGENDPQYDDKMRELMGNEHREFDLDDPLVINWTSVSKLKQFNGAYIVGGGRNECLREVELLMNAFNIKYKRVDSLVYG